MSDEQAFRMQAHRRACPACAQAEAAERELCALWRDLPAPSEAPDVWPRLSARLAGAAIRPGPSFWRWGGGVRMALVTGATAAAAIGVFLAARLPDAETGGTPPAVAEAAADERRVVSLVARMQELPRPAEDALLSQPSPNQRAMRLLVGDKGF